MLLTLLTTTLILLLLRDGLKVELLDPLLHFEPHSRHLRRLDQHVIGPVRPRVQREQLLEVQEPGLVFGTTREPTTAPARLPIVLALILRDLLLRLLAAHVRERRY